MLGHVCSAAVNQEGGALLLKQSANRLAVALFQPKVQHRSCDRFAVDHL
jgi:hypothetical protein